MADPVPRSYHRLFVGFVRLLLLSLLALIVGGELYMRLPFIPQRLEYLPDQELGAALKPSQQGYMWLANMSATSPPITLNADGHRRGATDWSRPVVLALGDSEGLGVGVADGEEYTAVAEKGLRRLPGYERVQVVNAALPGSGPYHHLVVLRRLLATRPVCAVVARMTIQDRNFNGPSSAREQEAAYTMMCHHSRVRQYTRFLPYLQAKFDAQLPSLRTAVTPWMLRPVQEEQPELPAEVGRAMWEKNEAYWAEMVCLTQAHQVPLLFLIHDPVGNQATQVLVEGCRSLIQNHPHCHLLRLGPEQFQLSSGTPEELRKEFNASFTLWQSHRDYHANPRQHRHVGEALVEHAKQKRWFRDPLDRLREEQWATAGR
jgi:hypothetical protein